MLNTQKKNATNYFGGIFAFHNKQLMILGNYNQDVLDGSCTHYHSNGKVWKEFEYVDGIPNVKNWF